MSTPRGRIYCSVYGCLKNGIQNPELSFFKIPLESERRIQWLQLISREDLINKPTINRICELHFNPQDIRKSNRKLLIPNSLPNLNLPEKLKEDKLTQTNVETVENSSQTNQTTVSNFSSQTSQTAVNNYSSQTDLKISCTSENETQTATSLSADTPRKRKLKSDLKDCQKRVKTLENSQTGTNYQKIMFHKLCDRFLSSNLAELVKAQTYLKQSNKGNRFPLEYKLFCLNLYYVSPQAYRLLQKTISLPCKTTLCQLYIPISTQVSDSLMSALKIKVDYMSDAEKHCTIVADAMSLKTNMFYDIKNDKIIGFHEVDGIQSPSPAKQALVILVRGIFVKWSQPIGFALLSECKNDNNISKWVDKIILKLFEIGLNVRAFVSDLGSYLFNAAKNRGISTDTTYFTINGHKIYYIFDAPHLIKLVRNNFMNYDFHFQNGAVAKFEHILKFYECDKNKTFKQAYKLTNSHINPSNFEKLKVRYATQLLSRSVASGLSTYIDLKTLDESAKHTVEFIKLMNDLFDALNSSMFRHHYKYKSAFHGDEHQIEFFNHMLLFFQNLKLLNSKNGNDGTKSVKFIHGFQITVQSILHLHEDLKKDGHQYLLTRRLNRDVLENFFSKTRSKNGRATEPTSRQFISAFRKIFFANLCQPPIGGNCVDDLSEFLVNPNDFKSSLNDPEEVNPTTTDVQENYLLEIVRSDYSQFDIPEKNAFFYVCGALLKRCINHHKDCELFRSYLDIRERASNSVESRYLSYRDYSTDQNLLVVPPDDFVNNVERLEQVFCTAFQKEYLNCRIGCTIFEKIKEIDFSLPCPCFPKQYLLKLYVRMRIYFTLKSNNQEFRISRSRRKYFRVSNL